MYIDSKKMKSAVGCWARNRGFIALEEIGGVVDGIIDVLLVPMDIQLMDKNMSGQHWSQRLGLRGVEIKRDRGDFLSGFKKKQYQKYARNLQGLYIATPKGMVKRSEIPDEYGFLSVSEMRYDSKHKISPMGHSSRPVPTCTCVRHPQLDTGKELTQEQMWMILWKIDSVIARERRELNEVIINKINRIEYVAGKIIGSAVRKHLKLMEVNDETTE